MIGTRVVDRRRGNVLYEWVENGFICRGWVRDTGHEPTDQELAGAAPYGDPFEEVLMAIEIDPATLADALRRHGVWTVADAKARPDAVLGSIASAAGLSVSAVQNALRMLEA